METMNKEEIVAVIKSVYKGMLTVEDAKLVNDTLDIKFINNRTGVSSMFTRIGIDTANIADACREFISQAYVPGYKF